MGNGNSTRARSHAHARRHRRVTLHLLVVAIALAAVGFAARYPATTSARPPAAVPAYSLSGAMGVYRATEASNYLRGGPSHQTLPSLSLIARTSAAAQVRVLSGISPSSALSAGVSAATAASGMNGASLAEVLDPSKPYVLYVARPGDTVSSIAAAYGVSVGTILDNNPTIHAPDLITVGQEILVPLRDGILHKVGYGETVASIVAQYDNVTVDAVVSFRANNITDPSSLETGRYILLPGATRKPPPPPPPAPAPSRPSTGGGGGGNFTPPPSGGGRFAPPLAAWRGVSDPFGTPRGAGRIHEGIDLDLWGMPNSPIFASCSGTVVRTEWWTYSYGYHIVIDCGDGWTTLYAHLSRIDVSVGQYVAQGAVIGLSGLTGYTTGEHLHFEIRYNGAPVDPELYINFR